MKLSYIGFDFEINFEKHNIIDLVIEKTTLYRQMINELLVNNSGIDTNFLLSDEDKVLQLDLNLFVFHDYFTVDINKKTINKYYKKLCLISETEFMHELYELKSKINEYIFNLLQIENLNINFDELENINLFKLINLQFNNNGNILENLLDNMKILNNVLGIEIFILTNIQIYFNENEIIEIFKFVLYNNFKVVLLENHKIVSKYIDKTIIIDNDLCEIF
ncbi:type II-A CRISPR-associated protein Csn2 [Caviibacter abscessus]|uniref:type II-A CRISPR-associated protein Csn2 n=1 Tax=Caviibacter abscessus TaxID=1766719 RepID=UPI00082FE238|nr:type II-A CRISPR-associated protein Csn2 [Caviibacter abscessus]